MSTKSFTEHDRKRWRKFAHDVVVERRRIAPSAWETWFARLERAIKQERHVLEAIGKEVGFATDPRELLIWTWCVLMAAPQNIAQFYLGIDERTPDRSGLRDEAILLRRNGYKLRGLRTSLELKMRWLGGLVRAIDADLAGINYWPSSRANWSAVEWRPEGYPCYVVPVQRDFRCEDGKDRRRRATQYHAIVPAGFGDLAVDLILHPEVASSKETIDWSYGAAAFDALTIDVAFISDDGFQVTDAPCDGAEHIIASQVKSALAVGCDVLVWPELTVPGARRETIRAALATDPLADPRRIQVTLAGSWHVEDHGKLVNRATLYSGRGRPLGSYDKRRQFELNGRRESITAGATLPVIVMEDRLISVAICLDFCDDCDEDVYDWLGIDLVLVPSMGAKSTIDAHTRSAKTLQSQQGAVSFVVQQVPVVTGQVRPMAEPPAYSLAAPGQGRGHPTPPLVQNETFRMLRGRR